MLKKSELTHRIGSCQSVKRVASVVGKWLIGIGSSLNDNGRSVELVSWRFSFSLDTIRRWNWRNIGSDMMRIPVKDSPILSSFGFTPCCFIDGDTVNTACRAQHWVSGRVKFPLVNWNQIMIRIKKNTIYESISIQSNVIPLWVIQSCSRGTWKILHT